MRRSLLSAAALSVVGQVGNGIGAVVTSVIVARATGPHDTGLYSLGAFALLTIGQLVTLGGPLVITRAVAEDEHRAPAPLGEPAILALARRWTGFGIAVGVVAAAVIALVGVNGGLDTASQIVVAAGLLGYIINAYGSAILAGRRDFRRLMLVSVAGTVAQIAGTVVVLLAAPSVGGFLAALTAGLALQAAALWTAVLRDRSRGVEFPTAERRRLRHDAWIISSISVLDSIVLQRTEIFALSTLSSTREVAYFALASSLVGRAMAFLPGAVTSVLLPRFAASDDLDSEFAVASRWSIVASVPLAGAFVAAGPLLVAVMYGPQFAPMVPALVIVALAAVITGFGAVGGSAAYATHTHPQILRIQAGCAALNVVLAIVLCGPYGATGAAIAGSIAQLAGVAFGTAYVLRAARLRPPWVKIARTALAGAIAIALAIGLRALVADLPTGVGLVVVSTAFAILFVGLLIGLHAIPPDELAALRDLVRRLARVQGPSGGDPTGA